MNHEELRTHLHDYVDGGLPEGLRLELEAHARACPDCGRELEAVREILGAAQTLPRSIEPPRDLWPRIESAIGGAAPAREAAGSDSSWRRRWFAWPLPALPRWAAAGALGFLGLFLVARESNRSRQEVTSSAASPIELFPAALSGLELECRGAGQLLQASLRLPVGPRTRATAASLADGLVSGLSILDRSIDETQRALAADPSNPELQRMLAARYQQKLALLHAALLRVETT